MLLIIASLHNRERTNEGTKKCTALAWSYGLYVESDAHVCWLLTRHTCSHGISGQNSPTLGRAKWGTDHSARRPYDLDNLGGCVVRWYMLVLDLTYTWTWTWPFARTRTWTLYLCLCVIDNVLSCDIMCVSVSFARIVCATSHDLTFHMSCMHAWLALILLFCLVMRSWSGCCVGTVLNLCLTTLFWSWSLWGPRL